MLCVGISLLFVCGKKNSCFGRKVGVRIVCECVLVIYGYFCYFRTEEDLSLEKLQLLQAKKKQMENERDKCQQEVILPFSRGPCPCQCC